MSCKRTWWCVGGVELFLETSCGFFGSMGPDEGGELQQEHLEELARKLEYNHQETHKLWGMNPPYEVLNLGGNWHFKP